jgi:exodeoxyribonuclease III
VKIATWNVNSIRMRQDRVLAWIDQHRPDVLCLQETKVPDDLFPAERFEAAGYQAALFGQKGYNGVAILARSPLGDVSRGLGDGEDTGDEPARLVAARVDGVRLASVYVPNGKAVGTDKYAYKLRWLARLRAGLEHTGDPGAPLVLCGDFNVAPEDRDIHDPEAWAGQVLCSADERAALAEVRAWGLDDVYRRHHPEGGRYSWWDYRGMSFFKDRGLRIDHVWATAPLAARSTACEIDRDARKGQNASDHAPVIATFAG